MIFELFEKEGLLEDFEKLSNKHLIHAEDFLKITRDADIEPNTIIFGTVNRLHLIKNKMKNNPSFQENAECVDMKQLLSWVEEQRPYYGNEEEAEPQDELLNEINEVIEPPEVIEEEAEKEAEEEIFEEPQKQEAEAAGGSDFKFEYLAQPVQISKIADGFSVHDYNPKELANAFIKTLGDS